MKIVNRYILIPFILFPPLLLSSEDGALLFDGNCVTCHHKTKAISAPSMREVKSQYKSVFSEKKDFVHYMSAFIVDPTLEHSVMDDKVKKYKLMPLLGYEKSVAEEISTYIYDTDF